MGRRMRCLRAAGILTAAAVLAGCGSLNGPMKKENDRLTVYLYNTDLIEDLTPYIHEQLPDKEIEFIAGNNDTDLYSYFAEHGELPDVMTVRRYAGTDSVDLQPYLCDFTNYDIVSEYSSYSLQYYKNEDGGINWLPICGIPQTIIANKTLFERYGMELPKNYEEYANACRVFHENGIKPYAMDLAEDWSSHELIQAGGIGELTSFDGILWRSKAENAQGDIEFDDALWTRIFSETETAIRDSGFTAEDLNYDTEAAMKLFTDGKAAMFHGSPVHMAQCQELMDAELVRLPYFSQTSDESFIYMTPSVHVAFNKELEKDSEKLDTAMSVLECMISEEGQKLIANGGSVISFNPSVPSITGDMKGLENEIENNNYYIRYSAQKSFAASVAAVRGLLTGTANAEQAYEAFKNVMYSGADTAQDSASFENEYSISLNAQNGRDAASSILTTVREECGADMAIAPYYLFTSSIYKGGCTANRLKLMIARAPNVPSLYLVKLTGAEAEELVKRYLDGTDGGFRPSNRYELPVASGMKLIVKSTEGGFSSEGITVSGKAPEAEDEYSVLLTDGMISELRAMKPDAEYRAFDDTDLSNVWTKAITLGRQPAPPEDYIEIRK